MGVCVLLAWNCIQAELFCESGQFMGFGSPVFRACSATVGATSAPGWSVDAELVTVTRTGRIAVRRGHSDRRWDAWATPRPRPPVTAGNSQRDDEETEVTPTDMVSSLCVICD